MFKDQPLTKVSQIQHLLNAAYVNILNRTHGIKSQYA